MSEKKLYEEESPAVSKCKANSMLEWVKEVRTKDIKNRVKQNKIIVYPKVTHPCIDTGGK